MKTPDGWSIYNIIISELSNSISQRLQYDHEFTYEMKIMDYTICLCTNIV